MARLLPLIVVAMPLACPLCASAQTLELLASARTNNRTVALDLRIPNIRANISAIAIRSGSLALTLTGIEIEYADGGVEPMRLEQTIPPGIASRPIAVDHRRPLSRVLISKQPGLRGGETVIQVLGQVERMSRGN